MVSYRVGVFSGRIGSFALPELLLVPPQGGTTEALLDHVVIRVVPVVLGGDILKNTMVCPEYVVCPVLHLPPLREHAPHAAIPIPWDVAWEEVACHVLEAHFLNRRRYS